MQSKTLNSEKAPLSFQEMIFRLGQFWAGQGCVVALPYDVEVGAGTMCPETFFRVRGLSPGVWLTYSLRAAPPMAAMERIPIAC